MESAALSPSQKFRLASVPDGALTLKDRSNWLSGLYHFGKVRQQSTIAINQVR